MSEWYLVVIIGLTLAAVAGCSSGPAEPGGDRATAREPSRPSSLRALAVRYQVSDVDRAVTFYTTHLGFEVTQRAGPAFAMVRNGALTLWLSGPKSSGARPMPDGTPQHPGGWNRIALEVTDLPAHVETLQQAGVRFRNQIETGPGGSQIQIEDPDGNPIELFQPASHASKG